MIYFLMKIVEKRKFEFQKQIQGKITLFLSFKCQNFLNKKKLQMFSLRFPTFKRIRLAACYYSVWYFIFVWYTWMGRAILRNTRFAKYKVLSLSFNTFNLLVLIIFTVTSSMRSLQYSSLSLLYQSI